MAVSLEVDAQHYNRTISSDGGAGQNFETKMTAFMLLRLYNIADEFYLANNYEKGEKFDDLVFTSRINKEWNCWFIQLKHKGDIEKKKISLSLLRNGKGNKDFLLKKYYESYNIIKKRFESKKSNDIIFKHDFSTTNFVIFTNAVLDAPLKSRERRNLSSEYNIGTESMNSYVFKFNPLVDDDIFQAINGYESREFLERLIMFTGQASEEQMDCIIEKEIKIALTLNSIDAKNISHNIYDRLHKWYKESSYLTKYDVHCFLSEFCLETRSFKKTQLDVEFDTRFLKNFIKQDTQTNLFAVVCSGLTLLASAAIQQALATKKHLLLNLTDICKNLNIINTWNGSENQFLIIDCENCPIDVNIDLLCSSIQVKEKQKFIVFLMSDENYIAKKICEKVKPKKIKFNCSLTDFTKTVREKIVGRTIDFQGYEVVISKLFEGNQNMGTVFNMNMLNQLFSGKTVSVGIKPIDKINYYVSRVLQRHISVNPEIFKTYNFSEIIAVSGKEVEKLLTEATAKIAFAHELIEGTENDDAKIVLLSAEKEKEEYEKLSSKFINVHWLKLEKNVLVWVASHSNEMSISSFIQNRKTEFVSTDNIMKIQDKVVLITAEPGMGKSTLLAHMAMKTKEACPYMWVINFSLSDYSSWFEKIDFKGENEEKVKELIMDAAGISTKTSKFDKRLFDQCYNSSGNLIVLLDGFDEISRYEKNVLQFLRVLKRSKVAKIWVTTRFIRNDLLQKELSTLSYKIKPFGRKDQMKFFHSYWKTRYPKMAIEKLDLFITKLLEVCDLSFNEKETQFTGVPLQTRMLAEAYDQNLQDYYTQDDLKPLEKMNVLELFNKFVDTKFKILYEEKTKVNLSQSALRHDLEYINQIRRQDLMKMALLTIFSRSDLSNLSLIITDGDIKDLKVKVTEGLETTGIVHHFKDEVPEFIHRTFAEYFAALFFSQNFNQNKSFLSSIIFESPYSFVKYMLDRMLSAGYELHTCILDNDFENFKLLLENVKDINSLDLGGKTPLHVASGLREGQDMVKMLIEKGADINIRDRVLGWTPIQYADKILSWPNVAYILEENPHLSTFIEHLRTNRKNNNWTLFKLAFEKDLLQLYLLLTNVLNIDVFDSTESEKEVVYPQIWLNEKKEVRGLTFYHLAAAYGAQKIMSYLLSKKKELPKPFQKQFTKMCVDIKDEYGKTPLHYAACNTNNVVTALLIEHDVDVQAKDKSGRSPLCYAVEVSQINSICILKKLSSICGNCITSSIVGSFQRALKSTNPESTLVVDIFLKLYPDLGNLMINDSPPLIIAIKSKMRSKVIALMKHKVLLNCTDKRSHTALHYAVASKDIMCTTTLLNAGVQVDCTTQEGDTPLHFAARLNDSDLIELLLKYNANVKVRNNAGETVLHSALNKLTWTVFKLLIIRGVDYEALNRQGKNVFDILGEKNPDPCINACVEFFVCVKTGIEFTKLFEYLEVKYEFQKSKKNIKSNSKKQKKLFVDKKVKVSSFSFMDCL